MSKEHESYSIVQPNPNHTLSILIETAILQAQRVRQGPAPFRTDLKSTTVNPNHDWPGRVGALIPNLIRDHNVQKQTVLALQLARRRRHELGVLPRSVRLRADLAIGAILDAGRAVVDGVLGSRNRSASTGGAAYRMLEKL